MEVYIYIRCVLGIMAFPEQLAVNLTTVLSMLDECKTLESAGRCMVSDDRVKILIGDLDTGRIHGNEIMQDAVLDTDADYLKRFFNREVTW
jgi:hypothetical protein